jgi:hypothetical protein
VTSVQIIGKSYFHVSLRSSWRTDSAKWSGDGLVIDSPAPRAPRRAPRRSKPRSTTSTSIKEVTNSPPASATPLKNMVTSLGRSSAEQASLALSGTSPLQSPPSSWPPRNTSSDRSLVTPTMTMTLTMTSRACHSQPLFATRTRVLKSASLK